MTFHRHPSFFPLVIFILTCALGGFMFVVFHNRSSAPAPAPTVEVNDATYRPALKYVLAPLFVSGGLQSQTTVDAALGALLQLRVPSTDLQTHLAFAMALNQLSQGLKGDKTALKDGQDKWQAAVALYPWVK